MKENFDIICADKKSDTEQILSVWEASVRATHHFLNENDIISLKKSVKDLYLPQLDIYCIKGSDNFVTAFTGLSNGKIEMLFVHPDFFGKGLGKKLLDFAVRSKMSHLVDVNEDNDNAKNFYLHYGFKIVSRDEYDSEGNPFPILHMSL